MYESYAYAHARSKYVSLPSRWKNNKTGQAWSMRLIGIPMKGQALEVQLNQTWTLYAHARCVLKQCVLHGVTGRSCYTSGTFRRAKPKTGLKTAKTCRRNTHTHGVSTCMLWVVPPTRCVSPNKPKSASQPVQLRARMCTCDLN